MLKKGAIALVLVGLVVLGWWLISGYRKPDDKPAPPVAKPVEPTAGSGSAIAKKPDKPAEAGDMRGAGVQIEDDPKGDDRLEGQVIDAEDHPVAGATVVLSSNPPRTATSGEDGGFAFDQLVLRPYTLIASHTASGNTSPNRWPVS